MAEIVCPPPGPPGSAFASLYVQHISSAEFDLAVANAKAIFVRLSFVIIRARTYFKPCRSRVMCTVTEGMGRSGFREYVFPLPVSRVHLWIPLLFFITKDYRQLRAFLVSPPLLPPTKCTILLLHWGFLELAARVNQTGSMGKFVLPNEAMESVWRRTPGFPQGKLVALVVHEVHKIKILCGNY